MATYVIGDIHGCYGSLRGLLARLPLDLDRDHLWLTGDLVNRGPRSLEVLRWARALDSRLGQRFVAVLGNHDLHLIARRDGLTGAKRRDTLEAILEAPDGGELVDWLARRPLAHRGQGYLLVHAGLRPDWSFDQVSESARRIERLLVDRACRSWLLSRRRPEDAVREEIWSDLSILTRVRTLDDQAAPQPFNGPPEEAPPGWLPWFRYREKVGSLGADSEAPVLFGHWAALGVLVEPRWIGLDGGCVWGGTLSAIRLEDRKLFQQKAVEEPAPD